MHWWQFNRLVGPGTQQHTFIRITLLYDIYVLMPFKSKFFILQNVDIEIMKECKNDRIYSWLQRSHGELMLNSLQIMFFIIMIKWESVNCKNTWSGISVTYKRQLLLCRSELYFSLKVSFDADSLIKYFFPFNKKHRQSF